VIPWLCTVFMSVFKVSQGSGFKTCRTAVAVHSPHAVFVSTRLTLGHAGKCGMHVRLVPSKQQQSLPLMLLCVELQCP
jgi:hypothetical protein